MAGFKSFVDPTLVTLHQQINAIVGPNGCGKSNIVDAVRWVIGGSAKQVRGQQLDDVIFMGSKKRQPVGKAIVELTFDNSDTRITGEYGAYNEISIRREVVRETGSSYFINGVQARRRDVVDLLTGTGLSGKSNYSVIAQGTVSELVEAKPDEMRMRIEELAGIAKYRLRREETQRRMARTTENLERLNDLRSEIDKQVSHLGRQAAAAEKYQAYQSDQVRLQAAVKSMEWRILSDLLAEKEALITEKRYIREEKQAALRDIEANEEALAKAQEAINSRYQAAQQNMYEINTQVTQLESKLKDRGARQQNEQARIEELEARHQELLDDLQESATQIESLEEIQQAILPEQERVEEAEERAKEVLQSVQERQRKWQRDFDQYQKDRMQASTNLARVKASVDHLSSVLSDNERQAEASLEKLSSFDKESLNSNVEPLKAEALDAQRLVGELGNKQKSLSEQIQSTRQSNGNHERVLRDNQKELTRLQAALAAEEARQHALLTQGDAEVTQWLSDKQLSEAPRLGAAMSVKPGWELAVETVLRYRMQAVCVSDTQGYDWTSLTAGEVMLVEAGKRHAPSGKPTLAQQVEADCAVALWLDTVYTASSLSEAKAMVSQLASHESVMTQEGHWMGPGWFYFSQPGKDQDSILKREQRIADLSKQVESAERVCEKDTVKQEQGRTTLDALERERDALQGAYQEAMQAQREADQRLNKEVSRVAECEREWARQESNRTELLAKVASNQQALSEARERVAGAENLCNKYEAQRDTWARQRDDCQQALSSAQTAAAQASQRAEELAVRLNSCEDQLSLLRHTRSRDERHAAALANEQEQLSTSIAEASELIPEWELSLQQYLSERQTAEEALTLVQTELDSERQTMNAHMTQRREVQSSLDSIQDQLTKVQMAHQDALTRQEAVNEFCEEHAIDVDTVLKDLPEGMDLSESKQELTQVERRLASLGPINLAAIADVEVARERQDYLNKQNDDLQESLNLLQSAIDTIDEETRELFRKTFETVNEQFGQLFPRVFKGGSAYLEATTDDWLTTGIIVKAQPPGKKNTSIHMLSGGEKALTAMALVFAMFRLNPAPFCVLDEVDAPLDDLNVTRFCDLVRAMSEQTQFLMISHNKLTIQIADQMMGITMQEPGVSRTVSVDMAEAIEMAGEPA